jgi:hypothetical protein
VSSQESIKVEERTKRQKQRDGHVRRTWPDVAGLEDGGRRP